MASVRNPRVSPTDLPDIAIFSKTDKISYADLQKAVTALQTQVTRDLKPIWGKDARLTAYPTEADIPKGHWKVWIEDEIEYDIYGYHSVDKQGVPFAKMRYFDNWTLVLSHELVETIVNPYVDFVLSSEVFEDAEGEEDFLVEIADPVQAAAHGYYIDGILVSDFFTPAYFNLTPLKLGDKYSFTGKLTEPKQLLEGGYYSFRTRLGEWWQARKALGVVYYERVADQARRFPLTTILLAFGGLLLVLVGVYFVANKRKRK